jgi:membrane protein implicated in regulation of membrane protease activity
MLAWFEQMQAWHWFALGLALLVAEIFTGTSYLLWPAAAAALTGFLAWIAPLSPIAAWTVFAGLTLVLTVTGRRFVRGRWLNRGASEHLNQRARSLIGQQALAESDFAAGFGRVKVADTAWRAQSEDAIAAGERVEIVGADAATLKVKRAS